MLPPRHFSLFHSYRYGVHLSTIQTLLAVFFFAVAATRDTSSSLVNSESSLLENELSIDFDSYNDIDERSSTPLPPVINGHAAQFPKVVNETTTTTAYTSRRTTTPTVPTTVISHEQETPAIVTQVFESSTLKPNLFNTIKSTILSPAKPRDEKITKMKKVIVSTPDTMKVLGFTSGHQNNFGVPIEEDERMLKMLDEELLKKIETQVIWVCVWQKFFFTDHGTGTDGQNKRTDKLCTVSPVFF